MGQGFFNGTDCLPVQGSNGETQWIFRLEDLREMVPPDIFEVIEKFVSCLIETKIDEWLEKEESKRELESDGYFNLCVDTRDEIGEIIGLMDKNPRMTKKIKEMMRQKLEYVFNRLNANT